MEDRERSACVVRVGRDNASRSSGQRPCRVQIHAGSRSDRDRIAIRFMAHARFPANRVGKGKRDQPCAPPDRRVRLSVGPRRRPRLVSVARHTRIVKSSSRLATLVRASTPQPYDGCQQQCDGPPASSARPAATQRRRSSSGAAVASSATVASGSATRWRATARRTAPALPAGRVAPGVTGDRACRASRCHRGAVGEGVVSEGEPPARESTSPACVMSRCPSG